MLPLESVPNVSEGRDPDTLAAIADACVAAGGRLLGAHADRDHHRSVLTLAAASDEALVECLVACIARALELIDLRCHKGVHPRVGAADVVPVVPLSAGDGERARASALRVAERVGEELGVPVFLYGDLAGQRRPAFYRQGGAEELERRIASGELAPAFGPARLHPTAGATLVGVRAPLVAFNVDLATTDLSVAREIAAAVRESSGGLPGVQAIGLLLATSGLAQVSMNIIDLEHASLVDVVASVHREARLRGVAPVRSELVGLVPAAVVREAAGLEADARLDASARAAAAAALGLESLNEEEILEVQLERNGLL